MEELSREERRELQRVAIELEQARQAGEELRKRIDLLSMSVSEIEGATETIEGVQDLDMETEILVPIGPQSYLTAKLTKPDKVLSGLGAELVAERESEEAVEMLNNRKEELEKSIERAEGELQKMNERVEELSPKVEELVAKARKVEESGAK